MYQNIIDDILDLPEAPAIIEAINHQYKEEQKRRLQFYNEVNETDKAEFINGHSIIHSPVMLRHSEASTHLLMLLKAYVDKHQLGLVCHEKIMISLTRNDYEPDICFFKQQKAQHFKADQCLFPAPDFVVEVLSKSTAKNDRGVKFKDYEAHGIAEYWIIDAALKIVEQYVLNEQKKYVLMLKSDNASIQSTLIKGFTLDIKAIFDKDKYLEALQSILR